LGYSSIAVSGHSFSSQPGQLPSGDDFYVNSANMVIMETTNSIFNTSLYTTYTTTQTVPYFIRIMVANRMATDGQTWSNIFSLYNSGTYNNQWQVVDFKQFQPGSIPSPNTLWILEQVPGFIVAEDQTDYLITNGYWPSYNIPFYEFIWNISGYPELYSEYGNQYSWSQCARAQIFRRDAPNVETFNDMKVIMRYNEWQTDPLSLRDACKGISARCDLNPPWANNTLNSYSAFGAIDSKITSNLMSSERVVEAVCGPTWDSQPVFAWTNQWSSSNYFLGQPILFDFDFTTLVPQQP